MRVSTAFNRLLQLEGASVEAVSFAPEGIVVGVRLHRRRRVCSRCGQLVAVTHDTARRRWRHLDLGGVRCFLEASLRRAHPPRPPAHRPRPLADRRPLGAFDRRRASLRAPARAVSRTGFDGDRVLWVTTSLQRA
jgi:hypothetical protein